MKKNIVLHAIDSRMEEKGGDKGKTQKTRKMLLVIGAAVGG